MNQQYVRYAAYHLENHAKRVLKTQGKLARYNRCRYAANCNGHCFSVFYSLNFHKYKSSFRIQMRDMGKKSLLILSMA